MRYEPEHKARTRERIVRNAARKLRTDGLSGPGVASVGLRPTVNPVATPLLEVHLFDCDDELYGRRLRVRFLRKLRDEAKFDSLPALREAIARDAAEAREYFARHG